MKKKAFKAAFPYTIPIGIGFLFLGMSYGFMMQSKGFSVWYPFFMSMFIFAGSMEFVTANLLLSAFSPIAAFFLALMVNARHLFYGLSMLDKYKNTGWKKFYLIFGMCDESFTVNCTVTPPDDVDRGWFMFFVNLLNQIYWVSAATAGALLGYVVHFDTTGIDFVMTALFVVMFLNQWKEAKDHRPGNNGNTFYPIHYFPGGQKSTGIHQVPWNGTPICSNRASRYLLSERRPCKQYTWTS